MVHCCVPNCKSRSDNANWKTRTIHQKLSFHCFPTKNEKEKKLWMDILGVSQVNKHTRICSLHFSEDSFEKEPVRNILKKTAKPFAVSRVISSDTKTHNEENFQPENNLQDDECHTTVKRPRISVFDCTSDSGDGDSPENQPGLSPPKLDKIVPETVQFMESEIDEDHSHQADEQNFPPKMVDKATMVDAKLIYNSPEKTRLRQRLEYEKLAYIKKMRAVQQKLRRKSEQVNTLQSLLKKLGKESTSQKKL